MNLIQGFKEFLGFDVKEEEEFEEGFFDDEPADEGYGYEESSVTDTEEDDEPLMDGGFFSGRRFTSKKSDRTRAEHSANRNTSGNLKVVLCNPTEFDNCPMICGHLRSNMTVVLNLENVKSATEKRRIFDFVSGCCFALDCNIRKISEAVYVVAPSSVDLLSEVDFTEAAKDTTNYFDTDYDL